MSIHDDFRRAWAERQSRERARDAISAGCATPDEEHLIHEVTWPQLKAIQDALLDDVDAVPYVPTTPEQEFTRRAIGAHEMDMLALETAARQPMPEPPVFGDLPTTVPMPREWVRTRWDLAWLAQYRVAWDMGVEA